MNVREHDASYDLDMRNQRPVCTLFMRDLDREGQALQAAQAAEDFSEIQAVYTPRHNMVLLKNEDVVLCRGKYLAALCGPGGIGIESVTPQSLPEDCYADELDLKKEKYAFCAPVKYHNELVYQHVPHGKAVDVCVPRLREQLHPNTSTLVR